MMAQNEQTTEEHSTLEQQSPRRLDHPAWKNATCRDCRKEDGRNWIAGRTRGVAGAGLVWSGTGGAG